MLSSIGQVISKVVGGAIASAPNPAAVALVGVCIAGGGVALVTSDGFDEPAIGPEQIALVTDNDLFDEPLAPVATAPVVTAKPANTGEEDVRRSESASAPEAGASVTSQVAPTTSSSVASNAPSPTVTSPTTTRPTTVTSPTSSDAPTTTTQSAVTAPEAPAIPAPRPTTNQAPQTTTTTQAPPTTTTQAPQTTTTQAPQTTTTQAPQTPINGSVLFVSVSGSDDNDGSSDRPFRSINHAIDEAAEGTTIVVSAGTYNPVTIQERSGLTLRASGQVTVTSGRYDRGAGFLIDRSDNITLDGFRVVESLWGIRVLESNAIEITNNQVSDIGQEGISVKYLSYDVTISGNAISHTGNRPGRNSEYEYSVYGEGIYLGSGGRMPNGQVDTVNDVRILDNHISFVTSEAIDVKASVTDVTIRGNTIHDVDLHSGGAISMGRGTRSFHGNHVVESNAIWNITTYSPWSDGVAIRVSTTATVRNNVIWNTQHDGILVDRELRSAGGGELTIDHNLVINPGQDAVDVHYVGSVPVSISRTIEGAAAESLLASYDQSASDVAPGPLLAHLESN